MRISIKMKGLKKAFKNIKADNVAFFHEVARRWTLADKRLIEKLVSQQYSGRPGLIKRSGEAAKAFTSNVKVSATNVISKVFINPNSPAKRYILTHDKGSNVSQRTIRAKNKPFLTFKLPSGKWASKKFVRMPVRTDIGGFFKREGRVMRIEGVNAAVKVYR